MLFIGHTRFSLFNPDSPSWKASNGSAFADREAYRDHLYASDRLDLRAHIFINFSIPQIARSAEKYRVKHLVLFSDTLPEKYQELLEDAAAKYTFLVLNKRSTSHSVITPEGLANQLYALGEIRSDEAFGIYRLDDDDILPVSYFDQMAPYMLPNHAGMQVSLGEGITALFIDGSYYNARKCYWPMFSAGLINVCKFNEDGTLIAPQNAPHNLSDRTNPVILDSRKPGFFWTRHLNQDTALAYSSDDVMGQVISDMSKYPLLEENDKSLEQFPAVKGLVSTRPGPGWNRYSLSDEENNLTEKGERFNTARFSHQFDLALDLTCDEDAVPGNALVSFDLVTDVGHDITTEQREQLGVQGIGMSGDPSIGYYRYLHTEPGRKHLSYPIRLPDGVECRSVMFRRWKRSHTEIVISNIQVISPSK